MKVNSESIYGTTASPFTRLAWGRCTKKELDNGAILYLHVFNWPADGTLVVPGLKNEVKQAYLLANKKNLKTEMLGDAVKINLPAKALDAIDTVVVLKIDGKLQVQKVLPKQNSEGILELTAEIADIHNQLGTDARLETRDGIQNIGFWTDQRVWIDWSFQIDKPGRFEISAELAIEAPKSDFEIISGDQKQTVSVVSTGGYDKFTKVTLGQMTFPQAGEYTLELKPVDKQWQPINLRSILLTPIKN
jgi:alpha-L-fucosidase